MFEVTLRKRTIGRVFFFFFLDNNWLKHWILNVKLEVGWSEDSDLTSDLKKDERKHSWPWEQLITGHLLVFILYLTFLSVWWPYDVTRSSTNTVVVKGAHALGSFTSTDSASSATDCSVIQSKRHCLHDCLYCNFTRLEVNIGKSCVCIFTQQRFWGIPRPKEACELCPGGISTRCPNHLSWFLSGHNASSIFNQLYKWIGKA